MPDVPGGAVGAAHQRTPDNDPGADPGADLHRDQGVEGAPDLTHRHGPGIVFQQDRAVKHGFHRLLQQLQVPVGKDGPLQPQAVEWVNRSRQPNSCSYRPPAVEQPQRLADHLAHHHLLGVPDLHGDTGGSHYLPTQRQEMDSGVRMADFQAQHQLVAVIETEGAGRPATLCAQGSGFVDKPGREKRVEPLVKGGTRHSGDLQQIGPAVPGGVGAQELEKMPGAGGGASRRLGNLSHKRPLVRHAAGSLS